MGDRLEGRGSILDFGGPIIAFSPDGSKVLTATGLWVHLADAADLTPVATALLPAPFLAFQSYGPGGTRLRVVAAPTGDSALPLDLDLEHPAAEPIEGDPAQLLEEWQRRLGMRITEAGTIEAVQ